MAFDNNQNLMIGELKFSTFFVSQDKFNGMYPFCYVIVLFDHMGGIIINADKMLFWVEKERKGEKMRISMGKQERV